MEITQVECKHVLRPPYEFLTDDIFIVKEQITYKDGSVKPNLRVLKNFEFDYYITKKEFQDHKQKKESESIDRLDKHQSTLTNIYKDIYNKLHDKQIYRAYKYHIQNSPYVYGIDIDPKAVIKKKYQQLYPDAYSPNSIAVLDTEFDIDTDTLLIISVATKNRVVCCINSKLLQNNPDNIAKLNNTYNRYIPDESIKNSTNVDYYIYDDEGLMLLRAFKTIHEWKTDFVAIWNIDYDIPQILKVCERTNIDPKHLFSHPDIDPKYRYFKYYKGTTVKTSDSGVRQLKAIQEIWNIVYCPSYSYFIDAMTCYHYIRLGSKALPSYSLDYILEKEIGSKLKKLRFPHEDTSRIGADRHRYLVSNLPHEYVIYNIWDCLSMLALDDTTQDLTTSISVLCGISSYETFNSNPKMIIDDIHYVYLEQNRVLGIKPSDYPEEELLTTSEWITVLDHTFKKNQFNYALEEGAVFNNIRGNVTDLDAVSSYPSDILTANVSRDTTHIELIEIEKIRQSDIKKANIDLFFGNVNHVDYCVNMFHLPNLQILGDQFARYREQNIK